VNIDHMSNMPGNQDTGEPELYFVKLPEDINNRFVLLLDPILASGSSFSSSFSHLFIL
jgi:uracil phosphoribosyltransferase